MVLCSKSYSEEQSLVKKAREGDITEILSYIEPLGFEIMQIYNIPTAKKVQDLLLEDALMKSLELYKLEYKIKFSTYFTWFMKTAAENYLSNSSS
jgi:hypothetical protein